MNKFKTGIALLLTAMLFFSFAAYEKDNNSPTLPPEVSSSADLYGAYSVIRVIDGDTFIADINGINTKIRVIGIDTPESVNPDKSKNCEEGQIASNYTKSLLQGKKIYLEYDTQKTDDYGRTLAYVYIDKQTMLQDKLLENGYAQLMTIQPNCKYADRFYSLQQKAKDKNIGFWKDYFQEEK